MCTSLGGGSNGAAHPVCEDERWCEHRLLVSHIVRGQARTSADVCFWDRGEQALKGVGEPAWVWAVEER